MTASSREARRLAIHLASLAMLGLAAVRLLLKSIQVSGDPGFDFRYLWLAGELWSQGLNPYGPLFEEMGRTSFQTGHQPILWVYPPTMWIVLAPLGLLDPLAANVTWNLLSGLLLAFSCAILTSALFEGFPHLAHRLEPRTGGASARLLVFALLVFALVTLEGTAILLAVGQTTVLILLGLSMFLAGFVRGRSMLTALGLTVMMMKPQIGLPFALFLLASGRDGLRPLGSAIVLSFLLCMPAMLISPSSIGGFLSNLLGYDSFTPANLPRSMTGLRLMVWEVLKTDLGNPVTSLIVVALVIGLTRGPIRLPRAPDRVVRGWQGVVLVSAIVLALAPLHVYDLMIAAPVLALLPAAPAVPKSIGIAGAMLMWRSEYLADLTGWHGADVEVFPGSRIATVGAVCLMVAAIAAIRSLNQAESVAADRQRT